MFCGGCGKEIEAGIRFCGNCGWKVPENASEPSKPVCKACGAEIVPGIKFCGKCGAKIEEASESKAEIKAEVKTEPKPEVMQNAAPSIECLNDQQKKDLIEYIELQLAKDNPFEIEKFQHSYFGTTSFDYMKSIVPDVTACKSIDNYKEQLITIKKSISGETEVPVLEEKKAVEQKEMKQTVEKPAPVESSVQSVTRLIRITTPEGSFEFKSSGAADKSYLLGKYKVEIVANHELLSETNITVKSAKE